MKKLLILGACLVALASQPVLAQTGGPEVVIVKIWEGEAILSITIARAAGKPEVLTYKTKELREEGASAVLTQKALAKLYQEGYMLKGTYGGNQGYLSTLVFVKGQ
ncbi:hypothetical protein FNT36_18440 [Hymenobacter setariae]|uniref:Uncharacterized protein n=1 Tax=Hymenobacter setariae TaxID=2594794 RepID=A0A558BT00_9BACT|nr:hypothetical protein [Hymenobacter setariae]TVT39621.1 hypothetical protein FNT36_18440 [Hymenobacter setariae]